MSYCATEVEDIFSFKPFALIDMSKNFGRKYRQDGGFGKSAISEDLFSLEDVFDFDEDEHLVSFESSLRPEFLRLHESLLLDDEDSINKPTTSGPVLEQIIGVAAFDDNASSLEKALTDAVGEALSACFQEEYNSDEMFVETLLSSSDEISFVNDHVAIAPASASNQTSSKSMLIDRNTSTPLSTFMDATPEVVTNIDKRCNNNSCITVKSKKRTSSFPSSEISTPKRPAWDFTDTTSLHIDNEDDGLPNQQSVITQPAIDTSLEIISEVETLQQLQEPGNDEVKCLSESSSRETTIDSDVSAMATQIAEWKQAARAAFEAARKIRAQMELEKFRADQAESTITQLTTLIRSKAARRRLQRITKMRRSQSLTHDAGSSTVAMLSKSANKRSTPNSEADDQNLGGQKDATKSVKSQKSTACRPSQINDQVRLALRAKVCSVNANTLQTAKDIVKQAEVLLKDLPVTTPSKNSVE